jgi:hypothetical protein
MRLQKELSAPGLTLPAGHSQPRRNRETEGRREGTLRINSVLSINAELPLFDFDVIFQIPRGIFIN